MSTIPSSVTRLIDEFNRLPGIGPKSASRLTYYLLRMPDEVFHSRGKKAPEKKAI